MLDYIVMASGYVLALCVIAYVVSKKKISPDDVIKVLDQFWDNEHIRSHMEKTFEDLTKKFEGSEFGKVIMSWWDDDEEENGDVAAVEKETADEVEKAAKKVKQKKAKKVKDEEE